MTLEAILVGIDDYPHYTPLAGCVSDVLEMETYLTGMLDVPENRITKLLAPRGKFPEDLGAERASYENVVNAIRRLGAESKPKTPVLVYFSGHGARLRTSTPELKGEEGKDECLVLLREGRRGLRCLRDVELGALLHKLTEAELLVTLVLDCCASGGGIRPGSDMALRGLGEISVSDPMDSLVASPAELTAFWLRTENRRGVQTRALLPENDWLVADGYAFLAACRAHEKALERRLGDGRIGGIFTDWLLKSLRDARPNHTYRDLYAGLLAKAQGASAYQTPVIEGVLERKVLGLERLPSRHGIMVLEVDAKDSRVAVSAGRAHGLQRGARLEAMETEEPLYLEIESLEATRSWAKPVDGVGLGTLSTGDRARLIHPGVDLLRRAVRVVPEEADPRARQVLRRLNRRIASEDQGFLVPASRERPAEFLVQRKGRNLTVSDAAGNPLHGLPRAVASVRADAPGAEDHLFELLDHLARFENVRRLKNPDSSSPLHEGVEIRLDLPTRAETRIPVGQRLRLRLRNRSSQHLNLAVIDLRPDWSISQLLPNPEAGLFWHLEPGETCQQVLQASLPEEFPERWGTDVLKVIATTEALDCRWLEQPRPRPAQSTRKPDHRRAQSPLDRLFAALAASPEYGTPDLRAAGKTVAPWCTAQLGITIER